MDGHGWRARTVWCTGTRRLLGIAFGCIAGCAEEPPLTNGVDAASHEQWFSIGPDAPHALGSPAAGGPIDCVSCHGGAKSFAIPQCLGCHGNNTLALGIAHADVAGYLPVDTSCYGCHPKGTRDAPQGLDDHSALFFPIGASDAHGGDTYAARVGADETRCTACHADVERRTDTRCAECHARDATALTTVHSALARSFQDNSAACMECHAETPIDPTMSPLSNHTAIATSHHAAACKSCHQVFRDAPQQWAIDFSASRCTPCHAAACTIHNTAACP